MRQQKQIEGDWLAADNQAQKRNGVADVRGVKLGDGVCSRGQVQVLRPKGSIRSMPDGMNAPRHSQRQ